MNKIKSFALHWTVLVTALIGLAFTAPAQSTNEPPESPGEIVKPVLADFLGGQFTNVDLAAYATIFPHVPSGTAKFGGGLLAVYNFNETRTIGAGLGLDFAGDNFTLFSGQVTFKPRFQPFLFTHTWIGTNLWAGPNVIGGIGTPISGTGNGNGNVSTVAGTGADISLQNVLGGKIGIGGEYVNLTGAGKFSGADYRAFLRWSLNF